MCSIERLLGILHDLLMKELHTSSYQIRIVDRDCINELALSIKERGLLQPIVVRPKHDYYEIIAGHRRYEACKLLNMTKMMCHVTEVDDKEAFEISLVENLQQRSMNPLEEARAFQKYVQTFGWGGESDLARMIGKSQEYISRRISLLKLPQEVQNDIMRRRISVSAAQELFSIQDPDSAKAAGTMMRQNNFKTRQVRHMVRVIKDLPDLKSMVVDGSESDTILGKGDTHASLGPYVREDLSSRVASRRFALIFKRASLNVRISLKGLDDIMESLDDEVDSKPANTNDDYSWVLRDLMMQHRLRLHEQLDLLINQEQKMKQLTFRSACLRA